MPGPSDRPQGSGPRKGGRGGPGGPNRGGPNKGGPGKGGPYKGGPNRGGPNQGGGGGGYGHGGGQGGGGGGYGHGANKGGGGGGYGHGGNKGGGGGGYGHGGNKGGGGGGYGHGANKGGGGGGYGHGANKGGGGGGYGHGANKGGGGGGYGHGGNKGGGGGGYGHGGNKGGGGGGYGHGANKGGGGGGYGHGANKGGGGGGYGHGGGQGGGGGGYGHGGGQGGGGGGYGHGANKGGGGGGYGHGANKGGGGGGYGHGGGQGGGGGYGGGRGGGGPRRGGPGTFGGSGRGGFKGRPPHARSGPPRGPAGPKKPRQRPEIIHEDADLIVIDKPAGLVTAHPNERFSAFNFVKSHLKDRDARQRVWVVHRLDRDVSGLTVFAKSSRAFKWLKEDLQARRMTRQYIALVEGRMEGDGTIQSFLREERDGVIEVDAHAVDTVRDDTRLAVTHYHVDASTADRSLLRVRLETGRKHQIRVQLAGRGHPVVGDLRYGAQKHHSRRCALHASVLSFKHPGTGEQVRFQSAPPAWFYTEAGREAPTPPRSSKPREVPRTRIDTSWEHVAEWYDDLIEERRSDHHEDVIIPGTTRLLEPAPGMTVLDVACGEGALCRHLASLGAKVTGVDASAALVEAAKRRGGSGVRWQVADARDLGTFEGGPFDAATCVMALMNMDPLASIFEGVHDRLRPGGAFIGVILHPSFRIPQHTDWAWVGETQARQVDVYKSVLPIKIVMNPGEVAQGGPPIETWTFHRPLERYVSELAKAGFVIDTIEEWSSERRSQPGPRAKEEDRARREIPMFLAFRAVRRADEEAPSL